MRSVVALVSLMLFSLVASAEDGSSAPQQFEAGKHYQVLQQPVPKTVGDDQIEVVEMFWYGCGHCYHFEPLVQKWKKGLPSDVTLVHSPAMWNEAMQIHAKAFYTAKALGVLDKLHQPLFDAINVQRKRLTTEKELAQLFAQHGVAADDFSKVFNSFGVNMQVKQADARARGYGLRGTPEVAVNGKYRVSASMAGGQAEMLQVVDYLIAKERQASAQ